MPEISGGDPSFRDDDGAADLGVAAALDAFAAGGGSEQAALNALAASRLLVPVVAVPADQIGSREGDPAVGTAPGAVAEATAGVNGGEKATEMALPTLIGLDGRQAVPAFTCLDSLRMWQPAARPVPVAARHVWQAATAQSCAVVIDVAGPVPLAVEGSRLAALARGDAIPAPYADPDVHEIVTDAIAGQLAIAAFELRPGGQDEDLVIAITLAPGGATYDVSELASEVADRVLARLGGRLRRGVAIWLVPSLRDS